MSLPPDEQDDLSPSFFVRALYDFQSSDASSLSFRKGALIEVLTQLESGWWDGLLDNQVRGWFPSNYVEAVPIASTQESNFGYDGLQALIKQDDGLGKEEFGHSDAFSQLAEAAMLDSRRREFGSMSSSEPDQTSPIIPYRAIDRSRAASATHTPSNPYAVHRPRASTAVDPTTRAHVSTTGRGVPPKGANSASRGPPPLVAQEEHVAYEIQRALSSAKPTPISLLVRRAHQGIRQLTAMASDKIVLDAGELLSSRFQHVTATVVVAIRELLYASGCLALSDDDLRSSSRLAFTSSAGLAPAITPTPLYMQGKRLNAVISKLVLSSRQVIDLTITLASSSTAILESTMTDFDLDTLSELRQARQRLRDDSLELMRVLQRFSAESESPQNSRALGARHDWLRPSQASVESAVGLNGIGPTSYGSVGASWTGNGFRAGEPGRTTPELQLDSAAVETLRTSLTSMSSCTDPASLLRSFSTLIALAENIDLASALDVDGPEDTDSAVAERNMVNAVTARNLVQKLFMLKQAAYDASSLLFLQLQETPTTTPSENVIDLCTSLVTTIEELSKVAEQQRRDESPFLGARHALIGTDDAGLMYLGPGIVVPDGPGMAGGTRRSISGSVVGSISPSARRADSSMKGGSVRSMQSYADSAGRRRGTLVDSLFDEVEDDSSIVSGQKVRRLLGEDAPQDGDVARRKEVEVPWFLEPDYMGDDIVFAQDGSVKGATLEALLARLTMHNSFDATFNNTFLMTYRSFTTTQILLDLLAQRFRILPPHDLTREELAMWTEKKQIPIRLRVFNVLKSWLESHFYEGEDDGYLKQVRAFAVDEMSESESMKGPSQHLLRLVERRQGEGEQMIRKMVMPHSAPPAIVPKNLKKLKFLEIDPLELARQLTLIESRLYNQVRPVECLGLKWAKPDNQVHAKGIMECITTHNRISSWVAEAILQQDDLKKRAAIIKHFINIADRCRSLNNFSAMWAIVSALSTSPIHRLRRTWDAVNQKYVAMHESLETLMSASKNWSNYRETIRSLNPPCVPFLGRYLGDLTFIEDGNRDRLKENEQLINFGKRQKTAEVIREITMHQSTPYNLAVVPALEAFVEKHLVDARSADELYEQSMHLEPREREDEKIARLLQESGFL